MDKVGGALIFLWAECALAAPLCPVFLGATGCLAAGTVFAGKADSAAAALAIQLKGENSGFRSPETNYRLAPTKSEVKSIPTLKRGCLGTRGREKTRISYSPQY
ncbi:hypothetical protein A6M23_05875 [Acidithiobacillus thiooxidans]|uniref:Lipoprotein n=1 Tax=Acidithiobacillus thiooxidans TaxID=930 RepID=A0A1C2IYB3_ACITH|nr:hypothetical protein A6M23_05875 [Acidithiobacillus thiooxidans]OCX80922.1 hypothetical protein A6P08_15260 [Acidithiobacillus thiooxidans]